MAEFCLDCWNKINGTNDSAKKYIISKDLDLCEGCGEWKRVIVAEKKYHYLYKFRFIIIPIKILCTILLRIIFLPYLIYKIIKDKNPRF